MVRIGVCPDIADLLRAEDRHVGRAPFTQAAAVAGYPHITVPAGFVHGLPCGISFVGTAWSEPRLVDTDFGRFWPPA